MKRGAPKLVMTSPHTKAFNKPLIASTLRASTYRTYVVLHNLSDLGAYLPDRKESPLLLRRFTPG